MRIEFDAKLKAHLHMDDAERVRQIHHTQEYWTSGKATALETAADYAREVAGLLRMQPEQLRALQMPVSFTKPEQRDVEYRKSEEKPHFDATTVGFYQTYLNVPVWQAGFTVTVKGNPQRVVSLTDTSQEGFDAKMPSRDVIKTHGRVFALADVERQMRKSSLASPKGGSQTADFVRKLVDRRRAPKEASPPAGQEEGGDDARVIRGRFFIYRYMKEKRLPTREPSKGQVLLANPPKAVPLRVRKAAEHPGFTGDESLTLPLAPVPASIRDGHDYLVSEVTFSYATAAFGPLNWVALVEVATGAVLYLRPLTDAVNGLVFIRDPISTTGDGTLTPNQSNTALNPHRSSVALANLDAPVGGVQSLSGSLATLAEIELKTVAAPTEPSGTDFNYPARTDNFAAVNAYYHVDRFFQLMQSLGFNLGTYFNNTTFPLQVDHRGKGTAANMGNTINAHCPGNGVGGIDHLCYAVADLADTANPIGIASDWRVHLHELGGHGVLWEHVNSANFGFSHSAGDSVAVILNDPESQAPDRFFLAPFVPAIDRRHDRTPAGGWGWGGVNDVGGYSSEQVLSSTLFRAYQSMGGDSTNLGRRQFASRMMTYLIFRAISTLTPATNPSNALGFSNALQATDLLNWTSEGVFGGAYNKVLRWAFEKQGLYQSLGAPTPVITAGAPPPVDVYIDDGRSGEYPYQAVHWANPSIWNRTIADGTAGHQEPVMGATNYLYVKIKNRGAQAASNVVVRGFHSMPGAGLLWPADFQALSTAQLSTGSLPGSNAEERTIGPFEWTPTTNAYGHDCLLMIVSADQDPSNVDNFTVGESIPEWRLVPNDNNVGQRNVYPVPGGGGLAGLVEALEGRFFLLGNPNPRSALMRLEVRLPKVLASRGWRLSLRGFDGEVRLAPGLKRNVELELVAGKDFASHDVEKAEDRDISVLAYADDNLIGGMTYRLDSSMKASANQPGMRQEGHSCNEAGRHLLECLDIPAHDLCRVRVRKVSVDFEMKDRDKDC